MEEGASQDQRQEEQGGGQVHLPLVQASYGMVHALAVWMWLPGKRAEGGTAEDKASLHHKLSHLCPCHCFNGWPALPGSPCHHWHSSARGGQRRMMVQASMHMGISVSMHGWAILLWHRTIVTLLYLALPCLPPNAHHLYLLLCHPRESCITLLPNGNDPPGDSLASLRAQGGHISKMQEGENESEEQALPGNNERKVEGSPFCPDISLTLGWVSCSVVPLKPLTLASCSFHCT